MQMYGLLAYSSRIGIAGAAVGPRVVRVAEAVVPNETASRGGRLDSP